jgi:hypothetical protein
VDSRLFVGVADFDDFALWIDESGYLHTVRNPLNHLGVKVWQPVRERLQLDDEVRADGSKTRLILIAERFQSFQRNPRRVGSAYGGMRRRVSAARISRHTTPVGFRPFVEQAADL